MKSKRLRPLLLLVCCLLAFSPSRGVNANPLVQTAKLTLSIVNQSHSTVCYVFIAPTTATEWGKNRFNNNTLEPTKTFQFLLPPGNYNVLLTDCDDNVLLDKRNLIINGDRELPLTQTDVNSAVCYTQNQQGRQAYRRGRYAEALTAFQAALVCYQAVRGDRSGESSVLNNMGVVYEAQQMDSQALESYKKALAIQQATGARLGESTSQ